jgi:hypothetical protein
MRPGSDGQACQLVGPFRGGSRLLPPLAADRIGQAAGRDIERDDEMPSGPGAGLQLAAEAGLGVIVLAGRVRDDIGGEHAFVLRQLAEHRTVGVHDP